MAGVSMVEYITWGSRDGQNKAKRSIQCQRFVMHVPFKKSTYNY